MFRLVEYVIIFELKNIIILMNYPIPREFSDSLFCTSFLILIASCITYYNRDYMTSFCGFCLFFTSINFWRNPQYNFHRTLDMTMCKFIMIFFIITSFTLCEFDRVLFQSILFVVILFNIVENILWLLDSHKWVIFHLAMHIYVSYFIIFIYYIL